MATSFYYFQPLMTMARTSSATARPAGGTRTRRTKAPVVKPDGVGAAETENRSDRPNTTYSTDANAPDLPSADALPHSSEPAADPTAAAKPAPSGLRLWLARARALGLTEAQIVFELHVRQGLPLLTVARVLGLGLEQARELWLQSRAARAALAPQSESDFASIREHISAALWQTVEATFPDVMANADEDGDADPPAAATPPMLSVRLKALDQIAKLYDLSLETSAAAGGGPLPYATPDDIADDVRLRVLEMHRRGSE